MEHAAGMTHLHSKGLTYTDICNLAETQYQEAKGVGKWPPATHSKASKALPSSFTCAKVHALVQCFQRGQPTSQLQDKCKDTCNLCSKKANKCLNKAQFTMKPHSKTAKPTHILWDLHNILDVEIHVGTVDMTKKDKEDSKQTNKVGNILLQQAWSPPSL